MYIEEEYRFLIAGDESEAEQPKVSEYQLGAGLFNGHVFTRVCAIGHQCDCRFR